MNNSKSVKCYIKNGESWKRCLLDGVHKLQPLSCKVRNNMETTLHVNEFKFHKPVK